jgi:hypothetical protein
MAHSWILGEDECWRVAPLTGDAWQIEGSHPRLQAAAEDPADADLLLLRARDGKTERWLLLASRERPVSVNGLPLPLGLRELRDRDEVLVAGRECELTDSPAFRFFYSTERLARIEPLAVTTRPVYCVRCKQVIEVGSPAVACPSQACGLWHHQSSELPCWEYSESCAACDQPTDPNVGFRWTPEEL